MFHFGFLTTFLLSVIGSAISMKIRKRKSYSDARLFGIPIVYYSVFYFSLMAIASLVLMPFPFLVDTFLFFFLLVIAFLGAFFSFGLLIVEIKYAECIPKMIVLLTLISLFIPFLIVLDFGFPLIETLKEYKEAITLLHLFGFAIGLGGATYSDILLMKFLNDFKISHKESKVITTHSEIIWIGVAVLILSGIGLVLTDVEGFLNSSKFLAKMFIFMILFINGVLLHLFILPKMKKISFDHDKKEFPELTKLREIAFVMGAISFVSWYAAFILGGLRKIDLSFGTIVLIYLFLVGVSIFAALFMDDQMVKKAKNVKSNQE